MATTKEFMDYVCEQLCAWNPVPRKMFGEYMVYIDKKPLFLVCDNTVYIKCLDCVAPFMGSAERDSPYTGAKLHYIVDIDDTDLLAHIVPPLLAAIPVPVKKNKK